MTTAFALESWVTIAWCEVRIAAFWFCWLIIMSDIVASLVTFDLVAWASIGFGASVFSNVEYFGDISIRPVTK